MPGRLLIAALSSIVVASCATQSAPQSGPTPDRGADRAAILAVVESQAREAGQAWAARDARLMFADLPDSTVVRTPDGRAITKPAMIADLQRRMDMTTRIDTMQGQVDSILFPSADEAVVWSSQRFVREMTVPGQQPRVRVSSVVHEQRFRREGMRWRAVGAIQEHNQRARWADEPERP